MDRLLNSVGKNDVTECDPGKGISVFRSSQTLRGFLLLPGVVILLFAAGCNDSDSRMKKVVVRGIVTIDGQPLPRGKIRFYPSGDTKGPVSGAAIKDGAYLALGRGGVPVGSHKVDIRAYRPDKRYASQTISDGEGVPSEQYLPERYNVQTTLTATVTDSTSTLDFELSSD